MKHLVSKTLVQVEKAQLTLLIVSDSELNTKNIGS